ncbi:family 16 glycosylhydrolase [Streptomyces spiramenti]|uniref:Family 16 glycosylhydrolase n=1 Tax=Streptomyces spiramenti TaxID=2720606 RepID=A0ABX1AII5_9ACTN|nr:family 16 glycosylhydrolase [Streptomyces spiramenti]NJP66959.1 family 16 glycosylhydrolase [Streptomyces spiramenti]
MRKAARRSTVAGLTAAVLFGTWMFATANAGEYTESFDSLNRDLWQCEFSCPTVEGGTADFTLSPGVDAREFGSWSKVSYRAERFTEGEFAMRFKLTERPTDQAVWWGLALWDNGPEEDMSKFNEINFGYTTDQSFENTELRFESAKHGVYRSIRVDTGVDLYDGEWHTGTLKYTAEYVQFYLDGELLHTISDKDVIPTDPMKLTVGPRLVDGSAPLEQEFTQSVDWVWFRN